MKDYPPLIREVDHGSAIARVVPDILLLSGVGWCESRLKEAVNPR
jgi:hypothetical protein